MMRWETDESCLAMGESDWYVTSGFRGGGGAVNWDSQPWPDWVWVALMHGGMNTSCVQGLESVGAC